MWIQKLAIIRDFYKQFNVCPYIDILASKAMHPCLIMCWMLLIKNNHMLSKIISPATKGKMQEAEKNKHSWKSRSEIIWKKQWVENMYV